MIEFTRAEGPPEWLPSIHNKGATMRITIEEATAFINFVRRADNEGQLSNVDCWGSGDTGSSSDEWGDDPYYEWVTLHFMDGEGEEHEISFSDTTCHIAREAMWEMVDAIGV